MKTAIYIEDGTVQLVITPESVFEKNAVSTLCGKPLDVQIFEGSFYDCRGGWVRQSAYIRCGHASISNRNEKSLILVAKEETEEVLDDTQ